MMKLLTKSLAFLVVVAGCSFAAVREADANTCYQATSKAVHNLCFLDLTGYSGAVGTAVPMSFTLPDGSTLTMTLTNTGTTTEAVNALPTYTGSALGNTAYAGVLGKPAIYGAGTQPLQMSNITLTDSQSNVVPAVTIVAADAETLDTGDGTGANITWTTGGTGWAQFQIMNSTGGGATPICTLSGLNTTTAKCVPSAGGNNAAYILSTTVTKTQPITLSYTTNSLQGYAFAIDLASLALNKTISGRATSSDQFNVAITRGPSTLASATTTGTNTTATTGAKTVVVGANAYTLNETATSGTLSQYVSTYACTNATAGSATTLPSGTGTSLSVTPGADDAITCTFTNSGLVLTDVPVTATKNVVVSQSTTDVFTLTNGSTVAGTFTIGTPTVVSGGSTSITPTGYTFGGNTYTTVAALQTAINQAGPTAAGGSISVGVVYTDPATAGTQVVVTLPATIVSGTSSSASASGVETDTTINQVVITKTATAQSSPGGPIEYTIVVANNGPTGQPLTAFRDPMPTGVTVVGTPTCGSVTGGAVCGGVNNTGTVVSSNITALPANSSVTFLISATATSAGTYVNTATATPTTAAVVTSSATTVVAATNGLTKTVRNVTAGQTTPTTAVNGNPGDTLEFGLTFTNSTSTNLTTMKFSDTIPTYTSFVSAACGTLPAGVTGCTISSPAVGAGGTVTWTFTGSLAPGATLTTTLRVTIN